MERTHIDKLADAITYTFSSPSCYDANLEQANIVDAIYLLANAIQLLGNGDANTRMGGMEALGKAILDSADRLASAISDLADAIRGDS